MQIDAALVQVLYLAVVLPYHPGSDRFPFAICPLLLDRREDLCWPAVLDGAQVVEAPIHFFW